MSEIRRGTTPTHIFHVNADLRGSTVYVTYSQRGQVIVEKTGQALSITEDSLTLSMTQEETLLFNPGTVEIQIRYVTQSGAADASNIIKTDAKKILKDGVINAV